MYYQDLSLYSYRLDRSIGCIKNIGRLDGAHDFKKDAFQHDFFSKLCALVSSRGPDGPEINFNKTRGMHHCDLCNVRSPVAVDGCNQQLGFSEFLVPFEDIYFSSPSLILHYIKEHEYSPPREYVDAVMAIELSSKFNAANTYRRLVDAAA